MSKNDIALLEWAEKSAVYWGTKSEAFDWRRYFADKKK